jgi:hypothetical protein
VTVIYRIAGSETKANSNTNEPPNAMHLQLSDREVYLFDLMSYLLVCEVGICYEYFAHTNHRGGKSVIWNMHEDMKDKFT